MLTDMYLAIAVFILIMACLNVIKNLFGIIKVARAKSGKFQLDTIGTVIFGMSISYILTVIILKFY